MSLPGIRVKLDSGLLFYPLYNPDGSYYVQSDMHLRPFVKAWLEEHHMSTKLIWCYGGTHDMVFRDLRALCLFKLTFSEYVVEIVDESISCHPGQ